MSLQRTVRFNEQPTVSHSAAPPVERPISTRQNILPERHNDALYAPYDVFTAASLGNFSFVEEQLRSGFYPDRLNSSGWSALMYAAYLGHGAVCSLLLDHDASINASNSIGQTALMLAAACGNLPIVQLLINKGAKLDQQDLNGNTALYLASLCSHNQVVELLLELGADPNIKNKSGMTPTLIACTTGHESTLVSVLQHGGNIYAKNDIGEDGVALVTDSKILAILKDPPQLSSDLHPSPNFSVTKYKPDVELSRHGKNQPKKRSARIIDTDVRSLDVLFKYLNLESKYYSLFKQNGIDLDKFLKLTENDLNDIGVKAFGPKKKMANAIERYRTDANFRFLLQSGSTSEVGTHGRHKQTCCEKTMEEFNRVQKELMAKDTELRKLKKILQQQYNAINTIRNASEQSRQIALTVIEELRGRQNHSSTLEKDVRLIETKQREILTELLEFCDK